MIHVQVQFLHVPLVTVSASPPRFLRDDDSYCVLEAECDQTAAYYWDTTGEACTGKCDIFLKVHQSKR